MGIRDYYAGHDFYSIVYDEFSCLYGGRRSPTFNFVIQERLYGVKEFIWGQYFRRVNRDLLLFGQTTRPLIEYFVAGYKDYKRCPCCGGEDHKHRPSCYIKFQSKLDEDKATRELQDRCLFQGWERTLDRYWSRVPRGSDYRRGSSGDSIRNCSLGRWVRDQDSPGLWWLPR